MLWGSRIMGRRARMFNGDSPEWTLKRASVTQGSGFLYADDPAPKVKMRRQCRMDVTRQTGIEHWGGEYCCVPFNFPKRVVHRFDTGFRHGRSLY